MLLTICRAALGHAARHQVRAVVTNSAVLLSMLTVVRRATDAQRPPGLREAWSKWKTATLPDNVGQLLNGSRQIQTSTFDAPSQRAFLVRGSPASAVIRRSIAPLGSGASSRRGVRYLSWVGAIPPPLWRGYCTTRRDGSPVGSVTRHRIA